jgi:hypothetical protein
MTSSVNDDDEQVSRVLDQLGITPEYLRGLPHDFGREAVSTIDTIEVTRTPSKFRWPVGLWRIDVDQFNQDLEASLDLSPLGGLPVGYCYMIRRKGRIIHSRSKGWAQLPDDPEAGEGSVAWDPDVPMNVASVSKFVTAIAIVKLLQSKDPPISVDTPIAQFLPQYWTTGPGIGAITFRDLLRHEAGLGTGLTNPDGTPSTGVGNFAEARAQVGMGTNTNGSWTGKYLYRNVNYAILRVLFATVSGTVGTAATAPSWLAAFGITDDTLWDAISTVVYCNYARDFVFAPVGIDRDDLKALDNSALAYGTPPQARGESTEALGFSGPTGWHLSVNELMRLLEGFRAGSIISRRRAQQSLSDMHGLDLPITKDPGTTVYNKGGLVGIGSAPNQKGYASMICLMPDEVDFAILMNSWDGVPGGHLRIIPGLIQNSMKFRFLFW